MVSAQARREAVGYAVGRGMSVRRACALLGVARSALAYQSRMAARDRKLRRRLTVIARRHPRYGYRRAWAVLRAKGDEINPKRVHRVWRGAGLSIPARRPRRRARREAVRPVPATGANQLWAYDFVHDACANGQKLKMLTVVDEYTRYCLAIEVAGRLRFDLRYLDAKPEGVQLYSCLLLEGLSRTILAGSLTPEQEVGVVLQVYFQALLRWGLWEKVVSDHGGQFQSHAFARANRRLGIHHEMYEKGHPWQNLIESQFGIQARIGEYHWERCQTIAAAADFHRELIRDHNRLPHWAHRLRNDQRRAPLEVLGIAQGKSVEPAALQQAFGQRYCQRRIDEYGFVRLGRWKIYVEEGLPKTPVQLSYWDGKLRAEYGEHRLLEYQCRWGKNDSRPTALSHPVHYEHPFQTRQQELFDPLWLRDPIAPGELVSIKTKPATPKTAQLRLYFGPELVKRAS